MQQKGGYLLSCVFSVLAWVETRWHVRFSRTLPGAFSSSRGWQSIISAVEEREYNEGRQDLHRGLTSAQSEAGLLRAELAEVKFM